MIYNKFIDKLLHIELVPGMRIILFENKRVFKQLDVIRLSINEINKSIKVLLSHPFNYFIFYL